MSFIRHVFHTHVCAEHVCAEHVCHKTHRALVIESLHETWLIHLVIERSCDTRPSVLSHTAFVISLHAWSVRCGYIWENLKIFIIYDDCKDTEYWWMWGWKGGCEDGKVAVVGWKGSGGRPSADDMLHLSPSAWKVKHIIIAFCHSTLIYAIRGSLEEFCIEWSIAFGEKKATTHCKCGASRTRAKGMIVCAVILAS